jgi:hypothetical protein
MSLDTTAFKAGLLAAESATNSFAFKSKKAFIGAKKLATDFGDSLASSAKQIATQAAVVGAAGAGFVVLAKNAFSAADSIADVAAQAGTSTTAIQELNYAAKSLGVDTQEMQGALVKIAKNTAAAKEGSKGAVEAFGALGISAQDLAGKRADEIFYMIAEGAKNTHDPIARTTALSELLGKGATNLALEISAGAGAFRELAAEAQAAGVIMSADIIAGAAEANAKLDALKTTLQAGLTKILAELGPYFTVAADRMREFVNGSGSLSTSVAPAIEKVASFIGILADGIRGMEIVWATAKAAGIGFAYAVNQVLTGIIITVGNVANAINTGLLKPFEGAAWLAKQFGIEIEFVNRKIAEINKTIEENKKTVSDMAATTAGLGEEYKAAADAAHELAMQKLPSDQIKDYIKDVKDLKAAHQEAAAAAGPGVTPAGKIAGVTPTEEKVKTLETEKITADKLVPNAELEQAKRDMEEFSSSMQATLSGSLSAAFKGETASIGKMWKDMLSQMVADSMAADLLGMIGIGGGQKSTGQSFMSGAADFFTGGGATLGAAMGGGARDGGGGGLTQLFNITTKDADSFQTARGRISSTTARGMNNDG